MTLNHAMAPDESGTIIVSHAASPSDFYIRLAHRESVLEEFQRQLATAMLDQEQRAGLAAPLPRVFPRVGECYVAPLPNNGGHTNEEGVPWRRVVVLAVARKSTKASVKVKVRLVDVGCSRILSSDALKHLPESRPELTSTPAFALACRLLEVSPPKSRRQFSSSTPPEWSKVACQYFASFVASHPLFFLRLEEGSG